MTAPRLPSCGDRHYLNVKKEKQMEEGSQEKQSIIQAAGRAGMGKTPPPKHAGKRSAPITTFGMNPKMEETRRSEE